MAHAILENVTLPVLQSDTNNESTCVSLRKRKICLCPIGLHHRRDAGYYHEQIK